MKKIIVLILFLFLILMPATNLESAKNAIALCINSVIPALFPFFVLSNLIIELGVSYDIARVLYPITSKLFGINQGATAFIIGLIGGYPVGTKTAINLYEKGLCNKKETERLVSFCSNSGPAFIVGIAGSVIFNSTYIGIILYVIHILSASVLGIILNIIKPLKLSKKISAVVAPEVNILNVFISSIKSGVMTSLNVSAFVIFFGIIIGAINTVGPILAGVIELSSGLNYLNLSNFSVEIKLIITSFLMAFSGLSIHGQAISFISSTDISVRKYIFGKIYHSIIAVFITILFIFCKIL